MSGARVFATTANMNASFKFAGGNLDYPEADRTMNFTLCYERSLGADGQAIANTLAARCEADFATLQGWFGVTPGNLPFKVYVDTKNVQGAMHYGCADTEIYVGSVDAISNADQVYCLFLAAEVTEVFEAAIGADWNCGYSNGEALSRVLPSSIYQGIHATDLATAPTWLYKRAPNNTLRQNWIDHADASDTNSFSVGCSVLFLNWLRFGLGYSWQRIIRAKGETLGETYINLTNQSGGWNRFETLVNTRFPAGSPTVTTDNPFGWPAATID